MLCAAPVALPAAVKAAAAPRPFVGRAIPLEYFEIGELKPLDFSDVARPLVDAIPEHYATEVTPMSDFADDVARYLPDMNQPEPIVMRGAPSLAPGNRGSWMQLASGRQFFPLDPRPEEIHIEDIASALSKLCRYNGHTKRFYSVAEHCVHVARAASPSVALEALMHDASEAYLCDIIRPIKPSLRDYGRIESALEQAIAERFDLIYPMPDEVKRLDNAILADERDQAMATPPADWKLTEPAIGVELQFWTPEKAEYEFLAMFRRLSL